MDIHVYIFEHLDNVSWNRVVTLPPCGLHNRCQYKSVNAAYNQWQVKNIVSFEKTGFPNKDFLILERSIFHEINCSLFSAKILLLLLNCLFQPSNIPALTHFQFSFNARKHSLWSLIWETYPSNKNIWIKLGEEMPFILGAGVSPGPSQKVIFIFFSDAGLPAMIRSLTLYLTSDTSINKIDNAS